jgi:hypothetical protein
MNDWIDWYGWAAGNCRRVRSRIREHFPDMAHLPIVVREYRLMVPCSAGPHCVVAANDNRGS